MKGLKVHMHARTQRYIQERKTTSFSLIADMFKEFGEDDLFDVDNVLLDDVILCLGIILQCCKACLYVFCQQSETKWLRSPLNRHASTVTFLNCRDTLMQT